MADKEEQDRRVVIGDAPPPTQHVCHNKTGGSRCDICFGPVPAEQKGAANGPQ